MCTHWGPAAVRDRVGVLYRTVGASMDMETHAGGTAQNKMKCRTVQNFARDKLRRWPSWHPLEWECNSTQAFHGCVLIKPSNLAISRPQLLKGQQLFATGSCAKTPISNYSHSLHTVPTTPSTTVSATHNAHLCCPRCPAHCGSCLQVRHQHGSLGLHRYQLLGHRLCRCQLHQHCSPGHLRPSKLNH